MLHLRFILTMIIFAIVCLILHYEAVGLPRYSHSQQQDGGFLEQQVGITWVLLLGEFLILSCF